MRIGIIGAGMVGGALGRLLVDAGHEVLMSSRHPEQLGERARDIGGQCGPIIQAATWGDAMVLAIPFGGTEDLDMAVKDAMMHKVVIDATNPILERDGYAAEEVKAAGTGSGTWTQQRLYGVHVVKAFNTLHVDVLEGQSHREAPRLAVPIASDHEDALTLGATFVRECGFDPVVVGAMSESAKFDPGTASGNAQLTEAELRKALGVD